MSESFDYRAVAEAFARRLMECGLVGNKSEALELSIASVEVLRARFGGREMYMPKRDGFISRTDRDSALLREWNGRNTSEICERYGISRRTLYAVSSRRTIR